ARFDWKKIFTRKHAVHHFSHGHPITPTVIIKRKHIDNEPHYTVRVKMPKLDHKGRPTGRHIYNRSFVTKKPSSMLHKMLTDAIHSQRTGKQHRERRVVSNEL
ncbi:MAG: hypothetical protein KGH75_13800, partial [Rhodospirillales bacterium]|nr:hypothetical protein [Rhodospirillales bacterium]